MTGPKISDRALIRFLERSGGVELEQLREQLSQSLARAHNAARSMGTCDHLVKVGGSTFVIRGDTVTTVLQTSDPRDQAREIGKRSR